MALRVLLLYTLWLFERMIDKGYSLTFVMDNASSRPKGSVIKNIYLYLVSFVALMMIVFSVADLLNTLLKTYIFTQADNYSYPMVACAEKAAPGQSAIDPAECERQQEGNIKQQEQSRIANRQSSYVRDLSMVVVAIPLFAYHWHIIRRKEENA